MLSVERDDITRSHLLAIAISHVSEETRRADGGWHNHGFSATTLPFLNT
jgi:hypothetical protein